MVLSILALLGIALLVGLAVLAWWCVRQARIRKEKQARVRAIRQQWADIEIADREAAERIRAGQGVLPGTASETPAGRDCLPSDAMQHAAHDTQQLSIALVGAAALTAEAAEAGWTSVAGSISGQPTKATPKRAYTLVCVPVCCFARGLHASPSISFQSHFLHSHIPSVSYFYSSDS